MNLSEIKTTVEAYYEAGDLDGILHVVERLFVNLKVAYFEGAQDAGNNIEYCGEVTEIQLQDGFYDFITALEKSKEVET